MNLKHLSRSLIAGRRKVAMSGVHGYGSWFKSKWRDSCQSAEHHSTLGLFSAFLGTCIERLLGGGAQAERNPDYKPQNPPPKKNRKRGFLGFFLTVNRAILASWQKVRYSSHPRTFQAWPCSASEIRLSVFRMVWPQTTLWLPFLSSLGWIPVAFQVPPSEYIFTRSGPSLPLMLLKVLRMEECSMEHFLEDAGLNPHLIKGLS